MTFQLFEKRPHFEIFNFLFDTKPQHHPGEIPIGSDMIHVSGRDRKDDLEDDDLAPLKP